MPQRDASGVRWPDGKAFAIHVDEGRASGLTSDEHEELRRLCRELKVVTEERET